MSSAASPLVTIVIPTFNRTRFLGEAIESALAQTYRNVEIVVSDDASTEDVFGAVVSRYQDQRVIYRRNPTNLGMGPNIWAALREAKGAYVATIHDDDMWEPGFLEAVIPPLEADPTLSVAFSDHYVVDSAGVVQPHLTEDNTRRWGRDRLPAGIVRDYLAQVVGTHVVPAAMAAVFRKSAIDWSDFPPEIGTYYDVWLTYLSARTGAPAFYDPRRLTRYRVHEQSETLSWGSRAGRLRALRQSEFLLGRYLDDPAMETFRPIIEPRYARAVGALGFALSEQAEDDEIRRVLARAGQRIRRQPLRALMFSLAKLPTRIRKPLETLMLAARGLVAAGDRRPC